MAAETMEGIVYDLKRPNKAYVEVWNPHLDRCSLSYCILPVSDEQYSDLRQKLQTRGWKGENSVRKDDVNKVRPFAEMPNHSIPIKITVEPL